ncbi:hypothetical protein BCR42DRAFT_444959 [Absidia repens]|uniref:Rieske domain-containing protein n=1 Tax=Absidia repens TaxID=90262 RepID=A0A1X2J003_9FUNG|nr:hypothetical protein BCR42DRAFT_444959 [Absidia repens]
MNKKGYSLFDSFVNSLASNENNNEDSTYLPDSMRTSTLLEQIGKERSWTSEQIDNDIAVLDKNRLYLVRDLRVLSNHSWSVIEILPIVRDLLKQAIHPKGAEQGRITMNDSVESWVDNNNNKMASDYKAEKKKKKKEKKEKKKKMGEPVVPTTRMRMMGGRDEVALAEHMGDGNFLASPDVMKDVLSDDPETIRNTIRNGSIDMGKEDMELPTTNLHHDPQQQKKSVSFSSKNGIIPQQQQPSNGMTEKTLLFDSSDDTSSSSSSNNSDEDHNVKKHKLQKQQQQQKDTSSFGLRPIKPAGVNRIQVKTASGQIYECDRFCPHKGVDLATWGQVLGDTVVCTKHNWRFSLDGNGLGSNGRSIHPCKLNDW